MKNIMHIFGPMRYVHMRNSGLIAFGGGGGGGMLVVPPVLVVVMAVVTASSGPSG